MDILVLHGPNLNLLGEREPDVYGTTTLAQVDEQLIAHGQTVGARVECLQSNHEGALIDILHGARHTYDGVVFNPGAYTHYSYALRDAVEAISIPVVEVHLSDIASREDFRRISVIAESCIMQISGKGIGSYIEGINVLVDKIGAK